MSLVGLAAVPLGAVEWTGRVVFEDGKPARSVEVRFERLGAGCAGPEGEAIVARTDETGRYRVDVEASRAWRLTVPSAAGTVVRDLPPTFAPDRLAPVQLPRLQAEGTVSGWNGSSIVSERAGPAEDPEPTRQERHRTAIRPLDEHGNVVPTATAWQSRLPLCWARVDDAGHLDLPWLETSSADDPEVLVVNAPGFERAIVNVDEARLVSGTGELLTVSLHRATGVVKLQVFDPSRQPVEDAKVRWEAIDRVAWSDTRGGVLFRDVPTGIWADLELSSPGFLPASRRLLSQDRSELDEIRAWHELARPTTALGRVVDEAGRPVVGARVTIGSHADLAAMTDRAGRFELGGIPVGQQVLQIVRDDEIVGMASIWTQPTGGAVDVGAVVLGPTTRVAGWAVDDAGNPVEGAAILGHFSPEIAGEGPTNNDGRPNDPRLAETDAAGAFTIEGLPSGKSIYLAAVRKGHAPRRMFVTLDAVEKIISLELVRLIEVPLRVISSVDRTPIVAAALVLRAESAGSVRGTDRDGRATFEVVPGSEGSVRILADGYVEEHRTIRFPERPDVEQTLELCPEAAIEGIVRDPDGRGLSGVQTTVIWLGTDGSRGRRTSKATTGADGRLEIRGLTEGPAVLELHSRDYGLQEQRIDLRAGEVTPVDLVLDDVPRFRLVGRVIHREGGRVAGLSLELLDRGIGLGRAVATDQDGWFSFERLPASPYTLRTYGLDPGDVVLEGLDIELDEDILDWQVIVGIADAEDSTERASMGPESSGGEP